MKRTRDGAERLVFAAEYVQDLQPGPAAIRAGYSPKTASQQGCTLLRDPAVQAEIQRLQAAKFEKTALKAEDVLEGLRQIAFADLTRLFTPEGDLIPLSDRCRA
jgi:phage terminase small subunit